MNVMFLCESMRNHHATSLQKHQSSSGQRLRFVGVFLRTTLEKATACKYSSRSMSKEKKKSSLIDDPTSYRCRRRLRTYGSQFTLCWISSVLSLSSLSQYDTHHQHSISRESYHQIHMSYGGSPSFIQSIPTSYHTFTVWKLGTLVSWVTSYNPKMTHHICSLLSRSSRSELLCLGLGCSSIKEMPAQPNFTRSAREALKASETFWVTVPSRELTYPTWGEKENHLQNAIFGGIC